MGADQHQDRYDATASALEWWADAGVDILVNDVPRDWLAPPPELVAPVGIAATPASSQGPLPDDLEAFLAWRTGPDAPEAAWGAPRVIPDATPDVALMVITDLPEADDTAGNRLLSGAAGRLLDRMLDAIGLSRDQACVTALALARPASGQIPGGSLDVLAEITRHHVALVAPERVLLLGQSTSRALLAAKDGRDRGILHAINHGERCFPAMATFHPRFLLDRPVTKGEAWKDLQTFLPESRP